MADFLNRRGILRGLAALPLIGGGVTLIGQPTAAAEPLTHDLLDSYSAWLAFERRLLMAEMYPKEWNEACDFIPMANGGARFHADDYRDWSSGQHASRRAAIVLSAVGCDWRS
ncbi:hypothetical protein ACMDCR_25765 [Labrys okinawensis]|uniref:hypothetical protein n=1 Tax=Labrys okinawensis TaxID=346911 RepID=UPI0039BC6955